jgi:integrase
LKLGSIRLDGRSPQLQVKRETTKTNKGARFVALDMMACWALRKLINRATRLGATSPDHFLLPTLLNKHTSAKDPLHGGSGWDPTHPQTSWDVEWDQVRKQAKIENRRFHDCRHSYITRAAEAGVPLMVVQSQVGHMSDLMTEHYTHISEGAQQLAADQIERGSADLLRQLGLTPRHGAESQMSASVVPGRNYDGQSEGDDNSGMPVLT